MPIPSMKTEAETGVMQPQAKERGLEEAGRTLPQRLWREPGPASIFMLAFSPLEL